MIKGRVWKYGDNINTDLISPPAYMELPMEEAANFAMYSIDKTFAKNCIDGDVFVAEENIGSGSSRETAVLVLKICGIKAVVAKSFARIFYRNCINLGLVAIKCSCADCISAGDIIEIDYKVGVIKNITKKEEYGCDTLPENILEIIDSGGLVNKIIKSGGYRREKD